MRLERILLVLYYVTKIGILVSTVYLMLLLIGEHVIHFYDQTLNPPRNNKLCRNIDPLSPRPTWIVKKVSCERLIEGNAMEIKKAKLIMEKEPTKGIPDTEFSALTKNCTHFTRSRGYTDFITTKQEVAFPIAYSILMYESVEQLDKLLRAIYRIQNVYCIHIDDSAPQTVKDAAKSLIKCFKNVFLVSKSVNVIYNHFSRLEAELNCAKDLLRHKISWKYFINLPGTQYPLKSNGEIVKILTIYNGGNDVEGITTPGRMMKHRISHVYRLRNNGLEKTNKTLAKPPHGIKIVKGSAYGVFSRKFVQFVFRDKRVQHFLEWCRDIASPDEYFWATLNHNPHLNAPGHYKGKPDDKPWLATYAAWSGQNKCHGKFRNGVCVFGIEDLPELVSRKELFANKFYTSYQPLVLDCLEEWIRNKSFNVVPFETFYYKQLPFIKKYK